jgi:SAM-dependent methyltransferase
MHTLRYDAGAGAYDRLTGRWSRMYVDRVLDVAGVKQGKHVLDVATGTGDAAITTADRVGNLGRVVAIDISAPMLQEATAKAAGRRIEFAQADAQQLSYADGSFDSIICLFGVMFIPNKSAALNGFRRVLRPGGRVVATSWDQPAKAPFAGLVAEALAEQLPDDKPDLLRPFSLADPDENVALYKAAGFGEVIIELTTALGLRLVRRRLLGTDRSRWRPPRASVSEFAQAGAASGSRACAQPTARAIFSGAVYLAAQRLGLSRKRVVGAIGIRQQDSTRRSECPQFSTTSTS